MSAPAGPSRILPRYPTGTAVPSQRLGVFNFVGVNIERTIFGELSSTGSMFP